MFDGGRALALIEGRPRPAPCELTRNITANRGASAGYIETLGVPLASTRWKHCAMIEAAPSKRPPELCGAAVEYHR
jgi:hypothetical protein